MGFFLYILAHLITAHFRPTRKDRWVSSLFQVNDTSTPVWRAQSQSATGASSASIALLRYSRILSLGNLCSTSRGA
jgi:hypothetical protein